MDSKKHLETANPLFGFAVFAFSFFLLLRTKLAKSTFLQSLTFEKKYDIIRTVYFYKKEYPHGRF